MAIGLDPNAGAKAHTTTAGTSTTLSLTTTNANDIIIVDVQDTGTNFSMTASSAALGSLTQHATDSGVTFYRFFKVAASPLSSDTITVSNLNGIFATIDAYAISGANTVTPFDAGGPVVGSGADPYSITTVNANTMVIGTYAEGVNQNPTAGSGFTQISGADFQLAEYKILSSAQTLSVTQTNGSGTATTGIVDAIIQGATAPAAVLFAQACL